MEKFSYYLQFFSKINIAVYNTVKKDTLAVKSYLLDGNISFNTKSSLYRNYFKITDVFI